MANMAFKTCGCDLYYYYWSWGSLFAIYYYWKINWYIFIIKNIMSKKLIITEEEKKRIKSLYEATILPPSESVLVANKNPFKYPEYASSRKLYSPELKNGDTFYVLIKQNNIVSPYNEIINNLIELYQEKTIRYNDKILKVSMDLNEYSTNSLDEDYFPYIAPIISGYIGGNMEYNVSYRVKPNNYEISLNFPTRSWDSKTQQFRDDSYYSTPSSQIESSTKPEDKFFVSFKNDLLKNLQPLKLENLPDEYFEIRKIERQKTD